MSDERIRIGGEDWVNLRDRRGVYTARPARHEITADIEEHYRAASQFLARQVEQGRAPWMVARERDHVLPHGLSGGPYTGANAVWLQAVADARGYADPRWSRRGAIERQGGQVRENEQPAALLHWRFAGKDERTGATFPTRVFRYAVYNAEQCRGLPVYHNRGNEWEAHPSPQRILAVPRIEETASGQARYDLGRDCLELPDPQRFANRLAYERTALQEVGHWTGHPDRLDRSTLQQGVTAGHDSRAYAREELRAEMHACLTGCRIGIGHDPERHARFAGEWAQALREDPREFYQAAHAAERISRYVTVRMPAMEPARPVAAGAGEPERSRTTPEREPGRSRC